MKKINNRKVGLVATFLFSVLIYWVVFRFAHRDFMFFISYPLTAVITYVCFIYWKHGICASSLCGILYAFLPWHYFYNAQIERYCYFLIPIAAVGLTDIATGKSETWNKRRWLGTAVILLTIGIFQEELAVVTMMCLFVSICYGFGRGQKRGQYKIIAMGIGLIIIIAAQYLRKWHTGTLESYSLRDISTSTLEVFRFFVPIPGHRIPIMNEMFGEEVYCSLVGEMPVTSMGMILGISFVVLLLQMIIKRYKDEQNHFICVLNLILIVICHKYCANVFLGQIFPHFKGYDVAYLFIALFACTALAGILDLVFSVFRNKFLAFVIAGTLTLLCVGDMSSVEWRYYERWDSNTQEYCINILGYALDKAF